MTGKEALKIKMGDNDAGASTVKEYLKELLETLWEEGEGFSGKRPFGNSGWEHEVWKAFVKAGAIEGEVDEDGYMQDYNKKQAFELIFSAIRAL